METIIFAYKPSFSLRVFFLYKKIFFNARIFVWCNKKKSVFESINPSSLNFFIDKKKSALIFKEFFAEEGQTNCISLDYIKKSLAYDFHEYFAFREEIDRQFSFKSYKTYGPEILTNILEKTSTGLLSKTLLYINYLLYFFRFLLFLLKQMYPIIFYRGDLPTPNVIYLRRKPIPDGFLHTHYFFRERKVTVSGIIFQCNRIKQIYGLNFINNYKSSLKAALSAIRETILSLPLSVKSFSFYSVQPWLFYNFLRDLFLSITLVKLESNIIYGSLADRSYVNLLHAYRDVYQRILVHGDGFVYPPDLGGDYINCDKFYSINSIERNCINFSGGNIKSFLNVGLYRQSQRGSSMGISSDLKELIDDYHFTILVTLNTVRTEKYFPIDLEYFFAFLNEIINSAQKHSSVLFIIKGKKGELKHVNSEISEKIANAKNIYTIDSEIPLMLKYNHFEDLVEKANLLISMHYDSMTIWQSLVNNVPVIGYNFYPDVETFFDKYKNFIVKKGQLIKGIEYWMEIDKKSLNSFLTEIRKETLLNESNSLYLIYEDIINILKKIKKRHL